MERGLAMAGVRWQLRRWLSSDPGTLEAGSSAERVPVLEGDTLPSGIVAGREGGTVWFFSAQLPECLGWGHSVCMFRGIGGPHARDRLRR